MDKENIMADPLSPEDRARAEALNKAIDNCLRLGHVLQSVLEARYGQIRDTHNDVWPGWWSIILEALDAIHARAPHARVSQVKEKFGGLRIYIEVTRDENSEFIDFSDILREAEYKSLGTCAVCGQPGSMRRSPGFILTLCDEHAEFFVNASILEVKAEATQALIKTFSPEELEEAKRWEAEHERRVEEARNRPPTHQLEVNEDGILALKFEDK
jgi:hypothetical protein